MDFLLILIAWWLLSPFFKLFYHNQLLFLLLLCGGIWLYRRRRAQASLTLASQTSSIDTVDHKLIDLLILRNELIQQLAAGTIDLDFFNKVTKEIDSLCNTSLDCLYITPDSQRWHEGREASWKRLIARQVITLGLPPWQRESRVEEQKTEIGQQLVLPLLPRVSSRQTEETQQPIASAVVTAPPQVSPVPSVPPLPSESVALLKQAPEFSLVTEVSASSSSSAASSAPVSSSVSMDEAWEPATPSALEYTLQTISRWPALLVPFLLQNILWFICGLCFVAGSTFLISSTSGQTNSLAVSGVLLAYSSFLLWIGYRLCRTRPELISGRILLALGILLIPLNIASTVRLIATAQTVPWITTGLFFTTVEIAGFYYTTILVSGVMDRSLQGRHPQLFLALTATQIAVPLFTQYPSWVLLSVTHCTLLGILAYSLQQFTYDWLHSILAERQKAACYAVGTLVYAAVVSFVHLTWGHVSPIILPAGYASPFLMAVCGMLFYVDTHLKQWTKQCAFLSHVSFFLYGLSILALLLSIGAPSARLLTLSVAIAVYGGVAWQYSTFTPLLLLLICCDWLYQTVILQHVLPQWYLLTSLPGLVGLLAATRWLQRRRETSLVSTCYWTWFGTTLLVCAWSLLHARPSLVAMTTALTTMGLIFYGLHAAPTAPHAQTVSLAHTDLRRSSWLYSVIILASLAIAYAPQFPITTWVEQTTLGIIALAGLWIALGLQFYRTGTPATTCQAEVLLNSALVGFGIALILAATLAQPDITLHRLFPLLLAAIGSGLLWMSLALRIQELFYGALFLWGITGTVLKLTYFPQPSTGTVETLIALGTWSTLWWLEHESQKCLALCQEYLLASTEEQPPLTLLGQFPVPGTLAHLTMLGLPLQQTMILLWSTGVWHLVARFLDGTIGWAWMCSAGLSAVAALIGTGYFCLPLLFPIAFGLGLGAWLAAAVQFDTSQIPNLAFAGTLYSLLVWSVSIVLLQHPQTLHLTRFLRLNGKRSTIEAVVHWTAVASSILCIIIPLMFVGAFTPSMGLCCTPVCVALFLGIAGRRYQNVVHSYLLLGVALLIAFLNYTWIVLPLHASLYTLFRDQGLGFLASVIGLALWVIAWGLSLQKTRRNADPILLTARLYHDPLCHVALLLAVFAINQALALAWADTIQGINVSATATLFLAGVVLFAVSSTLGHRTLQISAILVVALATLWGEVLLVHPNTQFTLWPGSSAFSDQWLTLSIASGSLARLAYRLRQGFEQQLYARPVTWAAAITYGWGLFGTVLLFASVPLRADFCLSLTFLVLMISLFPLVQSLAEASATRGFALPLLGSAFLVSTSALVGISDQFSLVALLWGFTLWAVANFALPRWNVRHPQWSVTPEIWPWFGFLSVSCCLLLSSLAASFASRSTLLHHAGYLTACAAYLLLMLRNSSWNGFSWIAVFLLARVGPTILSAWWAEPPFSAMGPPITLLPLSPPIGELVWLNLLLFVVPWWQVNGEALATRLGWQRHNLPLPFLLLPAGFFTVRLCHFVLVLCTNNPAGLFPTRDVQWLALCIFAGALTVSFLHLWWRHRQAWEGHALFGSFSCTALVSWLGYISSAFHFPFFVALWSAALYIADFLWEKQQWGGKNAEPLRRVLSQWLEPTLIAAITAFVLLLPPLNEQLLALLVLINTAAVLGWRRQQRHWLLAAGAMILILLHDWPLLWVPFAQIPLLWPWYSLQLAVISWLLLRLSQNLQQKALETTEETNLSPSHSRAIVGSLLSRAWQITACVSIAEWFAHAFSLFLALAAGRSPQWLSEHGDVYAALSAAAVLVALGARQAWMTRQPQWTYSIAVCAGVVGFYLRLVLIGLAPASAWDTTALIVATYALFTLYHLTRLEPLLHVVMVMPLLLWATIPLHLASPHAGAAFVAASALYLLTYRKTERALPLYLALAAFNAALYLWIPVWAEHYNVVQLYVTPVALSVLFLTHLHRLELKPRALSTIRLAATTTLYVSATSDVFLHQGLGVFIVALALSLVGVFCGIAFRVRAFLYTGVVSLVCNLGWQLIMLFPEQRLSQAVILLTLAALLAGTMTWFNAQRESILQRVRIFRSDLETWA